MSPLCSNSSVFMFTIIQVELLQVVWARAGLSLGSSEMQRSGSLLNMFEPTCQWFVILNTIVLNFKRWTFIQKALQALSLFCIPWIENSVIFWIDLDVWDLTKFPPKKPNWQGAIYFVCCFQVLFLNNCSILFKILNMWDKWKNWYQHNIPLYGPVHENHLPNAASSANYNPWRFGNGLMQAQHRGSQQQDPGV